MSWLGAKGSLCRRPSPRRFSSPRRRAQRIYRRVPAGATVDDSIHTVVGSFLKTISSAGVQAVTRLPYVEELAVVDTFVAALQGKDLAPVVKELGLGRLAKRLAELAVDDRRAVEAPRCARRTAVDVNPETSAQDPTGAGGALGSEAAPTGGQAP